MRTEQCARVAVKSSVIGSIGYDRARKMLEIEFLSGRVYQYFDVPRTLFEQMLASESKGSFFNSRVRNMFENGRMR